jgi:hypothetical protein
LGGRVLFDLNHRDELGTAWFAMFGAGTRRCGAVTCHGFGRHVDMLDFPLVHLSLKVMAGKFGKRGGLLVSRNMGFILA